ncbi:MAG: carbohydrate porin [Melioribacteraceae bacterium]
MVSLVRHIELTYSFNLLEWLKIQPDIRYVINSGESIYNRALVAGLRVEMNF